MDFGHDVHDWLGGYPYQTIGAVEIEALLPPLGLRKVREFALSRSAIPLGVCGSGCDEFVYRRPELTRPGTASACICNGIAWFPGHRGQPVPGLLFQANCAIERPN